MQQEHVMVVDKSRLIFDGGIYDFVLANHFYIPRDEAEASQTHKQIIPYVIVTHNGDYLLFKRKKKQMEVRLHDKYSLGVGGHINPPVNTKGDPIILGLLKELHEELALEGYLEPEYISIINDDSNEVGRCHLGFLFSIQALSYKFSLPEQDKMSAEWISKKDLPSYHDKMETWSQIILDRGYL